jgi:hypothetical protein
MDCCGLGHYHGHPQVPVCTENLNPDPRAPGRRPNRLKRYAKVAQSGCKSVAK